MSRKASDVIVEVHRGNGELLYRLLTDGTEYFGGHREPPRQPQDAVPVVVIEGIAGHSHAIERAAVENMHPKQVTVTWVCGGDTLLPEGQSFAFTYGIPTCTVCRSRTNLEPLRSSLEDVLHDAAVTGLTIHYDTEGGLWHVALEGDEPHGYSNVELNTAIEDALRAARWRGVVTPMSNE